MGGDADNALCAHGGTRFAIRARLPGRYGRRRSPNSAARSGLSLRMKAPPAACTIGRSKSAARRITSSSTFFKRSWKLATSPPSKASRSGIAKLAGDRCGGETRYKRQLDIFSYPSGLRWLESQLRPPPRPARFARAGEAGLCMRWPPLKQFCFHLPWTTCPALPGCSSRRDGRRRLGPCRHSPPCRPTPPAARPAGRGHS